MVFQKPSDRLQNCLREIEEASPLVAPYCAIPRDYLSDTPLLRAMGFWRLNMANLGAIPPPPFLRFSPLESMRSGGAIPPPQKGYLSDTCAIPYENKANGCDTPLRDTISKGCWGAFSLCSAPLPLCKLTFTSFHRVPWGEAEGWGLTTTSSSK